MPTNKHWRRQFSLSCVTRRFFKIRKTQIYPTITTSLVCQGKTQTWWERDGARGGGGRGAGIGEGGGGPAVSTVGGAEGRQSYDDSPSQRLSTTIGQILARSEQLHKHVAPLAAQILRTQMAFVEQSHEGPHV